MGLGMFPPVLEGKQSPTLDADYPYYTVFLLEDGGGNRSSIRVFLPPGNTIEQSYEIYDKLVAVTNAAVMGFTIHLGYRARGDPFPKPGSGSQVEAYANLKIRDAEFAAKKHMVQIPSPDPSIFLTSSGDGANVVDPNNADVIAFVGLYSAGGSAVFDVDVLGNGLHSGRRKTRYSKRG